MNNEPVAWFGKNFYVELSEYKETKVFAEYDKNHSPFSLYDHKAKELTEQDLDKLVKDAEKDGYVYEYIAGLIDGFNHARAILRKAQE